MPLLQAKLIKVGNSTGLTVPASALRAINATSGDIVEFEITRIVEGVRTDWNDASKWQGVDKAPMLLDGTQSNDFDDEEWSW